MANAMPRLIVELDREAKRLGIQLRERGLGRRLLSLYYANATWDMTDDGDKLKIRSLSPDGILLWEERHPVEYVVEVMEAIARRRAGNVSGASIV